MVGFSGKMGLERNKGGFGEGRGGFLLLVTVSKLNDKFQKLMLSDKVSTSNFL